MTTYAPIVHDEAAFTPDVSWPTAGHSWGTRMVDIRSLCATLEAEAVVDLSDITDRVATLEAAINASNNEIGIPTGLWTTDPADLTTQIRQAASEWAARSTDAWRGVRQAYEDALVREASAALLEPADQVVATLGKEFDKHLATVSAASKAGITEATNPAELADSGTDAQLKAYRGLGTAVAGLNRIAGLRGTMAAVLGYGPIDPPVASFLAEAASNSVLQGAWNRWAGEYDTVQYEQPTSRGSTLRPMQRKRLGGAWLALVNGGYQLRLNTAAEAEALIARAQGD